MDNEMNFKHGNIYLAECELYAGKSTYRPFAVVNERYIPITTKRFEKTQYVMIGKEQGLLSDGYALTDQVNSFHIIRLVNKLGELTQEQIDKITLMI
jgi:mRNA-degrading endonuclease toxin of MazEF toxin-antitoxin module